MTLDPQAKAFLDLLKGAPAIADSTVEANRYAIGVLPGPGPEVQSVEEVKLPLQGRVITGRIYTPLAATGREPVILFFHGGGWIMGSATSHDHLARALCRECQSTVLSVNYRLAPEHPFPAAADDAYEATLWASKQFPGRPLVVAGDSAGGNLAAVTSLLARDRGQPRISLQILMYPIVDCRFDNPSYLKHAEGTNLTKRDMEYFWDLYCPDHTRRLSPMASPLQEFDLTRLPEAIVITAEYDPLCSEGEEYARRLERAGVTTALYFCPGMIHGFLRRLATFDQGQQILSAIARTVRERLS